jgi:hypothetical protein
MKVRTSANHQKHKIKNEFHHKDVDPRQFDITPNFRHLKWPPVGHLGFFENVTCGNVELDYNATFHQVFRAIPTIATEV